MTTTRPAALIALSSSLCPAAPTPFRLLSAEGRARARARQERAGAAGGDGAARAEHARATDALHDAALIRPAALKRARGRVAEVPASPRPALYTV